jgi:hypothetical protein
MRPHKAPYYRRGVTSASDAPWSGGRPPNLSDPAETVRFPGYTEYIVELGDVTVARVVQEPGWLYSRNMATAETGRWCESHHIGGHGLGATWRSAARRVEARVRAR